MNRKIFYQILGKTILLLSILIASCSSTPKRPEVNAPSQTKTPTSTELTQSNQITNTLTPTTSTDETNDQDACPPFEFDTKLPYPDIPEKYIGYHPNYRELPFGLENLGGGLIRNNLQIELSIHNLRWQQNKVLYLLEKMVCRDESGKAYFEIVDVFATPTLTGNGEVPDFCFRNGIEIDFTDGLGYVDDSVPLTSIGSYLVRPFTEVLFIYKVDYIDEKFIFFDLENLKCYKDGGPRP
jgi:hypothetical protein